MKTDYIPLHTAINIYEDYSVEIRKRMIGNSDLQMFSAVPIKDEAYYYHKRIPTHFPKEIGDFLYYFHDTVYIGNEKHKGISLYGKYKDLRRELVDIPLVKISIEDVSLLPTYNLERKLSNEKKYQIEHSYRYNERYREDYNYAVLTDALSGEIQYTELSVKYEEFAELMKLINEYIEIYLEKYFK